MCVCVCVLQHGFACCYQPDQQRVTAMQATVNNVTTAGLAFRGQYAVK